MGYVELMQIKKQKFNMVNWVHLARIGDIAQTSMDMVMNFLDITRLKNGEMELHKTSKDIGEIVHSAVSSISCLSENRNFVVELPNRPVRLKCDENVIHRVITNLLVNTFKFTGKDKKVSLVVFVKKDMVRVEVHHESPGIPKKFHKKIFEKFGMAEIYKNGDSYFTGLGLTFCKLAVGAHGGEIGVDSETGRDNMFWFSLPCLPLREKEENFEKQTFTTTYQGR
jgi:K+-sensing histidine kinase KdpD